MASPASVLTASSAEPLVLRATWRAPTPELIAHQAQRFSHSPAETLCKELFPIPKATEKLEEQVSVTPESGAQMPSSISQIATPTSSMGVVSTGALSIEKDIERKADSRHVPRFYTLEGPKECDALVSKIMEALEKERQTLLSSLQSNYLEQDLEDCVVSFGTAFRSMLEQLRPQGLKDSTYGKFVSNGRHKVHNPKVQDGSLEEHQADTETNKPDILILESGVLRDSQYEWPMLTSFIEVKRTAAHDCAIINGPLLQTLRYTWKLFYYRSVRSHIHFVTWCGPLVRLWYVDAAQFGCSLAYSIKEKGDLLDIGRIFYLLTSSECRHVLTAGWDPGQHPPQELVGGRSLPDFTGPFQRVCVRPGLFGSRTALWAAHNVTSSTNPNMRIFLKMSWRASHLLTHEIEMQEALKHFDHTPRPFGRVSLPASVRFGFKERTSYVDDDHPPLVLTALMYEHRLGYQVNGTTGEACLTELNRQLAQQLLDYSRIGLHYRDLNAGNVLIENNTTDVLVLADHGNMRRNLKPRGSSKKVPLGDILVKARDDTRSANPMFLPYTSALVKTGTAGWDSAVENLKPESGYQNQPEDQLDQARTTTGDLRECLRDILVNSHRYIDDLESAVYLQIWQGAQKSRLGQTEEGGLTDSLSSDESKKRLWTLPSNLENALKKHCPNTTKTWRTTILRLHKIIHRAQKEVHLKIERKFDEEFPLDRLEAEMEEKFLANQDLDPTEAVLDLFKGAQDLLEYESLMPEEETCFLACIKELEEATRKLKLQQEIAQGSVLEQK